MMKNKVIIKAVFPSIDKVYDIKIPVNELIWKVSSLVSKAVIQLLLILIYVMEVNCFL